jgi:M6 family metalloprotease-like protein
MRRGIISILVISSILLSGSVGFAATPKSGLSCSKQGQTQVYKGQTFKCLKTGKKLIWGKGVTIAPKSPNSSTPSPSPTSTDIPASPASAFSPYETCQLKDTRTDQSFPYGTSFTRSGAPLPSTGTINIAILPLDFSDYPGTGDPSALTQQAIKDSNDWIAYESQGRLRFNWMTTNHWLRLAKPSGYYKFDKGDGSNYLQTEAASGQQYMDAADSTFDLSNVQAAILMFPHNTDSLAIGGYSHGYRLQSSKGTITPVYFGGEYNFPTSPSMMGIWMHELGHFLGIVGHAPGNGSPLQIMTNQFGASKIMNAWESAILGWLDSTNIACLDQANLSNEPVTIKLASIDGDRTGVVSAFVKINNSQELVIESRKPGKYSDLNQDLQGLVAYVVDTSIVSQRCDQCNPSYALEKKQYAYYLQATGAKRGYTNYGPLNLNSVAKPGESFTYEGITVKYTSAAERDTIQITKR